MNGYFDPRYSMNVGVRRTYIWSQLNPKSKGNLAIKSKSSEIIKSLNPSGGDSQINTNWQLYRMANAFYTLIRGSGELKYCHSYKESISSIMAMKKPLHIYPILGAYREHICCRNRQDFPICCQLPEAICCRLPNDNFSWQQAYPHCV